MVIGFSRSVYSAFEGSDPSVEVTVTVMDGTLGFDFSVLVRTDDSSQQATATRNDESTKGQPLVTYGGLSLWTLWLYIYPSASIRESVDSLCRDDADMPMPPYIQKTYNHPNAAFIGLFR